MSAQTLQTLGSLRIDRGFNPSKDPKIDEIKGKAGELLDLINSIDLSLVDNKMLDEVFRLKVLAQDHLEIASMFAVKAQVFSQNFKMSKNEINKRS